MASHMWVGPLPALSCCSGPWLPLVKRADSWLPLGVLEGLSLLQCASLEPTLPLCVALSTAHPLPVPWFAHPSTLVTSVPVGWMVMLSKAPLGSGPGHGMCGGWGCLPCGPAGVILLTRQVTRPSRKGSGNVTCPDGDDEVCRIFS